MAQMTHEKEEAEDSSTLFTFVDLKRTLSAGATPTLYNTASICNLWPAYTLYLFIKENLAYNFSCK